MVLCWKRKIILFNSWIQNTANKSVPLQQKSLDFFSLLNKGRKDLARFATFLKEKNYIA